MADGGISHPAVVVVCGSMLHHDTSVVNKIMEQESWIVVVEHVGERILQTRQAGYEPGGVPELKSVQCGLPRVRLLEQKFEDISQASWLSSIYPDLGL